MNVHHDPHLDAHLFVDLPIEITPTLNTYVNSNPWHLMITRPKLQEDPTLVVQMMLMATKSNLVEPKTICSALKDPPWVKAMLEEF